VATDNPNTGEGSSTAAPSEVLNLNDVLTGFAVEGGDNVGACLTFQTVGNSTVISIDTDGAGPAAPIAVLTLANVAGKTLQDLLNDIPLNL
jgi:hypothetical protein